MTWFSNSQSGSFEFILASRPNRDRLGDPGKMCFGSTKCGTENFRSWIGLWYDLCCITEIDLKARRRRCPECVCVQIVHIFLIVNLFNSKYRFPSLLGSFPHYSRFLNPGIVKTEKVKTAHSEGCLYPKSNAMINCFDFKTLVSNFI